jgi:GDPmannose 4,6-dehydratase
MNQRVRIIPITNSAADSKITTNKQYSNARARGVSWRGRFLGL